MRTYVYVDGFNLYYGALKNSPYKWLDIKDLFKRILRPSNEIQAIKYYIRPFPCASSRRAGAGSTRRSERVKGTDPI